MADDRVGDSCWGSVAGAWIRGKLRQWVKDPSGTQSIIFEEGDTGNLKELPIGQVRFVSDKPND
jgi:hypothetical protein